LIFKPLESKRSFKYKVNREIDDSGKETIYLVDDDPLTIFVYLLIDGNLILKSKVPNCPTRLKIIE
jgi:hypothetical protein